jgi:hypothetical protein
MLFPNLLCKLNAADGYRGYVKSLEPEHRPNPLFDAAMILFHNMDAANSARPPTASTPFNKA